MSSSDFQLQHAIDNMMRYYRDNKIMITNYQYSAEFRAEHTPAEALTWRYNVSLVDMALSHFEDVEAAAKEIGNRRKRHEAAVLRLWRNGLSIEDTCDRIHLFVESVCEARENITAYIVGLIHGQQFSEQFSERLKE